LRGLRRRGDVNVGSLFSGIGGFDLGLERAGMRVVWQCEQDEYCRRVLARHWPGVPCHPDVRALVADTDNGRLAIDKERDIPLSLESRGSERGGDADGRRRLGPSGEVVPVPVPYVDVLCGGFPCQDLSYAGKGAGLDGERSGLWAEYARLIRELRPRYVIVENVPALLARGMERVLGDLAAIGYDAEWDCIPAAAVGAPHRRDRVWVVAYPNGAGLEGHRGHDGCPGELDPAARSGPDRTGGWWLTEPDVGRVAHGVPDRVDRLRALGNALVPQIAQWLGERILEHEQGRGELDVRSIAARA
jgi:DNA (cytosine-5)-methyltransferase 1